MVEKNGFYNDDISRIVLDSLIVNQISDDRVNSHSGNNYFSSDRPLKEYEKAVLISPKSFLDYKKGKNISAQRVNAENDFGYRTITIQKPSIKSAYGGFKSQDYSINLN